MIPIMFSAASADAPLVEALLADTALGAQQIKRDRVTGGSELLTVLVMLTPAVLAAIVKILRERWARNGTVVIEARGVRIEGASPDDIEAILKQVLEHPQDGSA